MQLSPNEHNNFSLSRFETMLKTNDVYFFDSEEFEEIIQYYLENGKITLAKKATKMGLEQHPTSVNLKLFKVEVYVFENELDRAEALLDELYLLEQSNEEIYIQKANILSRREDHKSAIKLLKKALKITTDKADVLSLLGMEYLFVEDFENAKYYFIKCLEYDQQDYATLYNVICCFDYLEQHEEVVEYLMSFLDKNPYSEVAWHQVGRQHYILEDYKKALTAFDFAIISDDRFIGAYLEKGKTLERLGQYQEAIDNYSITLTLGDPTSFALLRIGKCYQKLNNNQQALKFYLRCVEEDSLLDKGWIAITDFYFKKQNYKKSLYYIEKAINIDVENVLYWKRYAKINEKLHLYEEAEHGFRRSIELGNYEIETWLSRSDVLIELGEYDAGVKNLLQASEFYPENAEIEYRLAGFYYKLLEDNTAEFHLKNALNLDEEFSLIIEELFPKVYRKKRVQQLINGYKNLS